MTHKAKSPDGFDATKINKSDGGAGVTPNRTGHILDIPEIGCVSVAGSTQRKMTLQ